MATEKWISGSGQGLTWGTALNAADVNSLPSHGPSSRGEVGLIARLVPRHDSR